MDRVDCSHGDAAITHPEGMNLHLLSAAKVDDLKLKYPEFA